MILQKIIVLVCCTCAILCLPYYLGACMKELTVLKNDANQRLDRFVGKAVPLLPDALLQKYIRIKRIKVNGKGAKRDERLKVGDVLRTNGKLIEVSQLGNICKRRD